jgi:hypothetical protein
MTDLTPLEKAVIYKLLSRDEEGFEILRRQLDASSVSKREFTGHGFYTTISLPSGIECPRRINSLKLYDVMAEIPELQYGAGFLLYIEQGSLQMLEGYCFGEQWPSEITTFKLRHASFRPAS